jgi:hypothetical protein
VMNGEMTLPVTVVKSPVMPPVVVIMS